VASADVDAYLDGVPEPGRATLADLRRTLAELLPDGEEGLAYGAPVVRVGGSSVAGFAAAARHLSYLPHSGTVLTTAADAVAGYATSTGALRFRPDAPLPRPLVQVLVRARLEELGLGDRPS
jgi:uncharacterized protein YdhG (YjbR/CyaY superfamily)